MHLSCLVSSCLVLSCLLLSCLVLRDSGRMFRVSLLRCLVCLARSLSMRCLLSVVCVVLCFVCVCVCLCLCSVVWFGFIVWLCGWFVCFGLLGLVWACVCWGEGEGVYCRCIRICIYVYMYTERRWSKIENGSVMRDPFGVAILTCKSFVVLWFRGEKQTEPSHS